jgi:mannose-1-phosphate guanylyltransferase
MKALVLAAGLGTRLRPITNTIPKCLVPIHGRPLLDYWLELLLASRACEQVLVNTGYLAGEVRRYVAQCRWADRVTLVHEAALLGTGGTVVANRTFFGEEAFFVVHGDNLTTFDPHAFIAGHRSRAPGTEMTMMIFATDAPSSCGIVETDASARVIAFHEKVANPPGNWANAAVYIFEPAVLEFMAGLDKTIIDLSTEVIPAFLGRIATFPNRSYHRDIGTPESLAKAEAEFRHASSPIGSEFL